MEVSSERRLKKFLQHSLQGTSLTEIVLGLHATELTQVFQALVALKRALLAKPELVRAFYERDEKFAEISEVIARIQDGFAEEKIRDDETYRKCFSVLIDILAGYIVFLKSAFEVFYIFFFSPLPRFFPSIFFSSFSSSNTIALSNFFNFFFEKNDAKRERKKKKNREREKKKRGKTEK